MTALGINFSSRDIDRFYWSKPSTHGKPEELTRIQNQIDRLSARYIRMCDVEPLPVVDLEELDDEIKQLEKVKTRMWNEWQCIKNVSAPIAVEADCETKNYLVNA